MKTIRLQNRLSLTSVLLLSLALILSACAVPAATTPGATPISTMVSTVAAPLAEEALFPLTITDATGQEFTFDAPPKIGCLWYGCHEIMADLGLAPTASDIDLTQRSAPFFFPAGPAEHWIDASDNPELWAATGVDLIITRGPDDPFYDALKTAAPIFFLHSHNASSLRGLDEFLANYKLMGQLTGQPAAADAAVARFNTAVASLKGLAPANAAALRFAMIEDYEGYVVLTQDQPFCQLLSTNGLGQCVGPAEAPGGESSVTLNAEAMLQLNPAWIAFYVQDANAIAERSDPVWLALSAVKNGQVYPTGPTSRYHCCSLRGFIYALQQYGHYLYGAAAGIPDPGLLNDFDPLQSPLLQTKQ